MHVTAFAVATTVALVLGSSPSHAQDSGAADVQSTAAQTDAGSFIRAAGESGRAEVMLAQLARRKSMRDDIKQYATRLHADHQAANKELLALASARGVTIPEQGAERQRVRDRLDALGTNEFDRAYVTQMVRDHEEAVALFEKGAASADSDVRAYAERVLPILKDHLAHAQRLSRTVAGPRGAQ